MKKGYFQSILMGVVLFCMGLPEGLSKDGSTHHPILSDVPGPYSFERISQKDYKGITLNIISHQPPNLGGAVECHARQFEALTGATINVTYVGFADLYPKIMWGLKENLYDVVFCGRVWLADMADFLEPLPAKMLESQQYKTISSKYKSITTWNGKHLLVIIDGDRHFMQYRNDLISDTKFRKEFKRRYDRDLEPPKTWKEFNEVAQFFQNKKDAHGRTIYGACEITEKNNLVYSQFIKRAAPYVKHPGLKGGVFFDPETMKPLINTPGFVEALTDFVETQKYYPPGGDAYTLTSAADAFARGEAVLSDMWDDAFVKATQKGSAIRDHVYAALSPGSKKVWNRDKGQWDDFPDVNHAPYIPSSWSSFVAKSSRHKDTAFDFLGFYANEANHKSDLLIGKFGMNAFRKTDENKSFWIRDGGLKPDVAESYIDTYKKFNASGNHVFALSIINCGQYNWELNKGIHRALSGRSSPQEALDDVANKWAELNEIVGIDRQRAAYLNNIAWEKD